MIYPRALSLYWSQNISFNWFPLLHTSGFHYLSSSIIHDTISLFKFPALWSTVALKRLSHFISRAPFSYPAILDVI